MTKKLVIGDTAPHFSVVDVLDQKVSLKSYASKYVLVVFLRYAGCPWCNLAIHRLTMEYRLLEDNQCAVVAFVQSSKGNIINNILKRHKHTPPFPIIADQAMATYKKYRVKPSLVQSCKMLTTIPSWVHAVRKDGFANKNIDGNLFLAPASFLLAPGTGKILLAEYEANLYNHKTFSDIYNAVAYNGVYK